MAGQAIVTRVTGDPTNANNGLSYFYSDHLGSASALQKPNNAVIYTWHLPFGGYRPGSAPTQTITDRDFTGQLENMELGLLYYQARFYVPGLGRFASADSIVPNPADPQSFNRYSYTENRPLKYVDSSGHCSEIAVVNGNEETYTPDLNDSECWEEYNTLYNRLASWGYNPLDTLGTGRDWIFQNIVLIESHILQAYENASFWHDVFEQSAAPNGTYTHFVKGYYFHSIYMAKPDLAFEHDVINSAMDIEIPESWYLALDYATFALKDAIFTPYSDEHYIKAITEANERGDTVFSLKISAAYSTGVPEGNTGLPALQVNGSSSGFLENFISWFDERLEELIGD